MKQKRIEFISLATISFVIIFAVWWVVTSAGLIRDFFLPGPWAVAKAMLRLFTDYNFVKDIGISLFRIIIGFLIAVILAVPIGIMIGLNKIAQALIEPVIDFARYTPIAAAIPLFILWFGIGETEKIVIIATGVFFQLVLMVANSVSFTPQRIIDSAKTLGVSRFEMVTKVIYPFSKPRIFDDLRISMGLAWAGLILAEIVGSTSGIGYVIIQSQRLLQTANVISAIIIVGLLGLLTDYIFKLLYKIYFPWSNEIKQNVKS